MAQLSEERRAQIRANLAKGRAKQAAKRVAAMKAVEPAPVPTPAPTPVKPAPAPAPAAAPVSARPAVPAPPKKVMVHVYADVPVSINGKEYVGACFVDENTASTIRFLSSQNKKGQVALHEVRDIPEQEIGKISG